MIHHIFNLSALIRSIIYASVCLSSMLVFASYYHAYRKQKSTWIIKSVMLLFLGMAIAYFFFTLAGLIYLIEGTGERYKLIISLFSITNIPILLAIINFWDASINQK